MTNDEEAEIRAIRAYVAERTAARARGEHIDSDERREVLLIAALDETRAQLAALHALAAASADAFEDISVSRAECEARNAALRAATFDLSTAAAEHERRVRAPVEAERDRLAAALAKVRDAASESIRESFWVGNDAPARAARERVIADRDSWRQQCEDARGDALRYGCERDEALARIKAAGDVVSDNGCDCACDHSTLHEDHDEDCEVCVVCRVADALWPEAGR